MLFPPLASISLSLQPPTTTNSILQTMSISTPTVHLLARIAEPYRRQLGGQPATKRQAQGGASTTTSSSSSATSPTGIIGSFQLGGGTPPSVYLICFVVIIVLLISISTIITLRAMRHRRRLHVAWRRTGYSDAFFDTVSEEDMQRSGMMGGRAANLQWPSVLGGGNGNGKEKKVHQKRPVMFEIGMGWSEEEERDEKGKGRGAGGSRDACWEGMEPISTTLLLPPSSHSPSPNQAPPPLFHPPPTFFQTLTSAPIRPPPPPPPPPIPPKPVEEILKAGARVEISVLIALPCEGGQGGGWQEEVRMRRRAAAAAGGSVIGERLEEDEGEELPEVWLGVSEGVELVDWEGEEGREKGR